MTGAPVGCTTAMTFGSSTRTRQANTKPTEPSGRDRQTIGLPGGNGAARSTTRSIAAQCAGRPERALANTPAPSPPGARYRRISGGRGDTEHFCESTGASSTSAIGTFRAVQTAVMAPDGGAKSILLARSGSTRQPVARRLASGARRAVARCEHPSVLSLRTGDNAVGGFSRRPPRSAHARARRASRPQLDSRLRHPARRPARY
jgi:hypothetical protein